MDVLKMYGWMDVGDITLLYILNKAFLYYGMQPMFVNRYADHQFYNVSEEWLFLMFCFCKVSRIKVSRYNQVPFQHNQQI